MANVGDRYKFDISVTYERYYHTENHWGIFEFSTVDPASKECELLEKDDFNGSDTLTGEIVGSVQQLEVGGAYELECIVVYNKKYKKMDLQPTRVSSAIPRTAEEQEKFLRALTTPLQANNIIEVYPDFVERILENKEIDLSKINGVKEYTFEKIRDKVLDNYVIVDLLTLLSPHGVSFNQIKMIAKNSDNPMIIKEEIEENPYVLTKIRGLGFKRVDKIALKLNPLLRISEERSIEFMKYILEETSEGEGHTYITRQLMIRKAQKDLLSCKNIVKDIMKEGRFSDLFHYDEENIGLANLYNEEEEIVSNLIRINESKSALKPIKSEEFDKIVEKVEKEQGFEFTDEQLEAVKSINSEKNNVIIIAGLSGTGKTSTVKGLIAVVEQMRTVLNQSPHISQCALSAKASMRMKEVTRKPASTIHRLLGYNPASGFAFNDSLRLGSDVIIADEFSMNNVYISNSLFKAVKNGAKLVLVFDHGQLPAIGAGSVAYDLLEISNFTKFKFTQIHRQAKKSGILVDASKIRKQLNPLKVYKSRQVHGVIKDMFYIFKESAEEIQKEVIEMYFQALKKYSVDEVSIITPRKNNTLNSAETINKIIQDRLIPKNDGNSISTLRGDIDYRLGDRVIQRVNDYDSNVFNGEIGKVINVTTTGMFVEYPVLDKSSLDDFKVVEYDRRGLACLRLAYALTVHSYQGSQNKAILVAIDNASYMLLDSTMLYTAITRAEERCLLIAQPSAFERCINQNKTTIRNTFMKKMLKALD